ncbi:MAG: CRISPR-associated protein Cas4 [Promethearchaeota archaeon]
MVNIVNFLKTLSPILITLIIIYSIYIILFGKKLFGQYSRKTLQMEFQNFILVGKPDKIIKKNGKIIIYEFKSRMAPVKPYNDHLIQLASYFLLFENTYHKKVDHGILEYKDKKFLIENTEKLRKEVFNDINQFANETNHPERIIRNHHNYGKCHHCQYKSTCKKSLV